MKALTVITGLTLAGFASTPAVAAQIEGLNQGQALQNVSVLETSTRDKSVPVVVKSLTDYPGRVRAVTETQKREIREVLAQLDGNTKFICTGARLKGQSQGMNLAVRERAKLVCEYAKTLRPDLSYWYQTKITDKRNFNGRVIVVSK